ncbi:lipid-A-disaccharide kinase [Cognatiyoonia koreensis]|uniref:Tetraacyldisaccharide 4'-kinase n=1 Tax=Cognatiyoonia koreensis TaxID=364200 RepID=A0A1I0RU41_9RHOB|nr:tetraacyldisaccharide 4'-kinase [Cognatiyoonia koreensis]SEW44941.1 lipid-A-disaccharide kinase [Cognatiyoonia koreensis]
MPAPLFWYDPPDKPALVARALAPFSALYAFASKIRLSRGSPFKAAVPVICVGNINIGGTGKTPTVIALIERLTAAGHRPHVISRGYGGSLKGPVRVLPESHQADETGDEPLLLAAFAPVWVAKDRAAGVKSAQDAGADVIVLDDGFQNPAVEKDVSIVVVDAFRGFGNGRVIPAGPLREPINTGLDRADLLLSIGPPDAQEKFHALWPVTLPHLSGQVHPLLTGMPWKGLRVLAFAGIGHPEKFFRTLDMAGALVVKTHALEDHEPLTPALMARLEAEARAAGAQLVTTEKDAARLPGAFRAKVLPFPVRLVLDDWTALDAQLQRLGLRSPD